MIRIPAKAGSTSDAPHHIGSVGPRCPARKGLHVVAAKCSPQVMKNHMERVTETRNRVSPHRPEERVGGELVDVLGFVELRT